MDTQRSHFVADNVYIGPRNVTRSLAIKAYTRTEGGAITHTFLLGNLKYCHRYPRAGTAKRMGRLVEENGEYSSPVTTFFVPLTNPRFGSVRDLSSMAISRVYSTRT